MHYCTHTHIRTTTHTHVVHLVEMRAFARFIFSHGAVLVNSEDFTFFLSDNAHHKMSSSSSWLDWAQTATTYTLSLLALFAGTLYYQQRVLIYPRTQPPGSRDHVDTPDMHGMPAFEELWLRTVDGDRLHAYWVKQVDVDVRRRAPTVVYCHANAGNMVGRRVAVCERVVDGCDHVNDIANFCAPHFHIVVRATDYQLCASLSSSAVPMSSYSRIAGTQTSRRERA